MSIFPTPRETNPCANLEAQAQIAYNKWFRFKKKNMEAILDAAQLIQDLALCAASEVPALMTCADVLNLPGHTEPIDVFSVGKPCFRQNTPFIIEEGNKAREAFNKDAVCSSLTPDYQPCYESTFRDAAQRVYACRDENNVPCPNFQWDAMSEAKVPLPQPM